MDHAPHHLVCICWSMDAEDASPFNPFHFWKERLRSGETEEGVRGGSSQQDLGRGVGGSKEDGKLQDDVFSAAPEKSSAFQDATKRRPPPRPPIEPTSMPDPVPKSLWCLPMAEQGTSTHGPSGLQERNDRVAQQGSTGVQERLEKLKKPSCNNAAGVQGRVGKLQLGSGQPQSRRDVQGKSINPSSEVANLQLEGHAKSAAGGKGGESQSKRDSAGRKSKESQSNRDATSVQERISRLEAGSDADSYMPTFKKSPLHLPSHTPGHTPNHTPIKKTTSSPTINADSASSRRVLHHIKSSGSLDSGKPPTPTTKFIPTIQTIRASTGDQLSADDLDLELYRPQRSGTSHQSEKVLDVAKKLDLVLLGAQLPTVGARGRRRRNSGGELPIRSRSGSSGDAKTPDGVSLLVHVVGVGVAGYQ